MIIQAKEAVIDGTLRADTWIETSQGMIVSVNTGKHTSPDKLIDGTLIPGFIDIHCHGGGGFYFSATITGEIQTAINAHKSTGTTSLLASLVSEDIAELKEQIERLVPLYEAGEILGVHLEGPFLSPLRCGAHEPSLLIDPTVSLLQDLISVGKGAIKMVTIAPELSGAQEVIRHLTSVGVIVAIGHTEANFEDATVATNNGASVVTHFFNAMNKEDAEGSIVNFVFSDARLSVELIADGHHISFEKLQEVLAKVESRYILVSDAMAAACAGDGDYTIGSLPVEVRGGIARLTSNQKLAGSTLTISQAFSNLIGKCGITIEQAVEATSLRPAKALGLMDRGNISVGMKAHLLEFDSATHSIQVIS